MTCGHAYCRGCLDELRAKGVRQECPLCRAELPPGLFDLGSRAYLRVLGMGKRGEVSWASTLPAAEQEEMDEVVAMLTRGTSLMAQAYLSDIYKF